MTNYLVTIREVRTFQVEVTAENEEQAEEAAFDLLLSDEDEGGVDLIDDEATVEEIEEIEEEEGPSQG